MADRSALPSPAALDRAVTYLATTRDAPIKHDLPTAPDPNYCAECGHRHDHHSGLYGCTAGSAERPCMCWPAS